MGAEAFLSEQVIGLSESIDDRVAALLQAGTGITLTYNDGDGTLTIAASSSFDGTFAALTDKPTTLSGYGITDAQPLDSDLTAIAALTTTSFGRDLLTQADAAATRSTIGAGTGTIGGSTGSTDNAVLRADGTGGATLQDSAFVIADIATASPNNTVNHASIQAIGATTNVSVSIVPKGTGAFCLAVPDGTATGGNARGANAIDLQTARNSAAQVASGSGSIAIGTSCQASAVNCIAIGRASATAGSSLAIGTDGATANGSGSVAIGFSGVTASGSSAVAIGSAGATATANCSIALGSGTASRENELAWGFRHTAFDVRPGAFLLSALTTNNTATALQLRNVFGASNFTTRTNTVLHGTLHVTGVKSDGSQVAVFTRRIVMKNVGGVITLVESQTVGTDYEDNTATDLTVSGTSPFFQVTGISGETWRWVGWFSPTCEIAYGT